MADPSPNPQNQALPPWRLWLFSAPSFPMQAIAIAVAVYLPQHFARNLGMDLAMVGAAFALVRLIDIPVDPLLGVAMDRTKSRWGRYRVWMALGAPAVMLAVYMLFMAKPGIGVPYVVVWLLLMYLGTSMVTLSHSAWGSTIATSYNERSRVFGAFGAAGVAGMSLLLAMPLLVDWLGGESGGGAGVQGMGWFIIVASPLAIVAALAFTTERVTPHAPQQGVTLRDYVAVLLNPNMARISLASFFFTLGTSWEGGLYMFYFTDARGFSASEASLLLMAALAAGLVGAPTVGRLATRMSKHGALIAISVAYGVALFSLWLIPASAPKWAPCIPIMVSGFLYAGFLVLLRSMTADIADEIRLQQGKERSALLYAVLTLAPKVSAAFAIWMTFTVLAHIGYQPALGAENAPASLSGLAAAYVLGPNGFVLLGAACMIGYKLGRQRAADIRRQLEERERAEVGAAPAPSRPGLAEAAV